MNKKRCKQKSQANNKEIASEMILLKLSQRGFVNMHLTQKKY